jgi:ankyrin repeat protein
MLAAMGGYNNIIHELLAVGARTNSRNSLGMTALMFAVLSNHVTEAEVLVKAGADLNVRRSKGTTVLIIAASEDRTAVTDFVLAHGANPN